MPARRKINTGAGRLAARDQARQSEMDAIRGALIKGEESGQPQAFSSNLFKEKMAALHVRKVR